MRPSSWQGLSRPTGTPRAGPEGRRPAPLPGGCREGPARDSPTGSGGPSWGPVPPRTAASLPVGLSVGPSVGHVPSPPPPPPPAELPSGSIGLGARLAMPVALEKRWGGARPPPFPPPARGARTAARAGGYSSPSPLPCEAMVSAGRAGPGWAGLRGVPGPAVPSVFVCVCPSSREGASPPASWLRGRRATRRRRRKRRQTGIPRRWARGPGMWRPRPVGGTPVPFGVEAGLARVGLGRARPRVTPGGSPAVGRGMGCGVAGDRPLPKSVSPWCLIASCYRPRLLGSEGQAPSLCCFHQLGENSCLGI